MSLSAVYVGDACVDGAQPGTCRQLTDCRPLLELVHAGGTPMPLHIRQRLKAAGCGFKADQPLVCCVEATQNIEQGTDNRWNNPNMNNKPWTSQWGQINNNNWSQNSENSGTNWGIYNEGSLNNPHTEPNRNEELGNKDGEWTDSRPQTNYASNNENSISGDQEKEPVVSDNSPPDVSQHNNLRKLPRNCGATEEERIWGGNRTGLFEMPWMVLIAYDSPRGIKLSCGGTLVTPWYVLTAAHCVSHLGSLRLVSVILGEHDVRGDPDCERVEGQLQCAPSSRNVTIASVIPHPGYTLQNLVDDIALIRLSEPADFNLDNVKPVCLPTTRSLQTEDLADINGVVAGWGATEDGLQSPVLLKVALPVLNNEACSRKYNGNPHIYERQLCAGGVPDKDSCGGDSGGPLMYPGRTANGLRYVQRGIVSFGSKRCGVGGYPGVYTRVAYYMDWILDNITD
ncbi:CLIP domain-containing serine protease 2 [Eumeta japonica]|uniref:CLIP domain-containing serine protease n=1 Tax=Eumeta variegata TaxID=151549 RepID=A0A4C1SPJ3_EUMVA|nr:CLIP domain-containing serine protease 2 [Eumeta japonica]